MISVILNVYKRPYTLEAQIAAIKEQSVGIKSENIHVWYNHVEGLEQPLPKDPNIKVYKANWNTKFFGRFMILTSKKTNLCPLRYRFLSLRTFGENCFCDRKRGKS